MEQYTLHNLEISKARKLLRLRINKEVINDDDDDDDDNERC
jgi:hypothetical protein